MSLYCDNDTRYTEDTVTYLVWVTHPRRYQIPRTQVTTKMLIQILSQISKQKVKLKIFFALPAMTAFVEATAGIIRFTTPEKIHEIKNGHFFSFCFFQDLFSIMCGGMSTCVCTYVHTYMHMQVC